MSAPTKDQVTIVDPEAIKADQKYYEALSTILSEWNSPDDDKTYSNL